MARLEDFLDQETLNKLRGIKTSSPSQDDLSDLSMQAPGPMATPTPGPTPIPSQTIPPISDEELRSLQAPNSSSIDTLPTKGMGPLANPNEYKPSVSKALEQEDQPEEESDPSVVSSLFSRTESRSSPERDMSDMLKQDQGTTENTLANLKTAQADANRQRGLADMAQAAAMITSGGLGLAKGTKAPDISQQVAFADVQRKHADEGLKEFEARGEQEKDDPGSTASAQARNLARAMLKQAGLNINIPDNISANVLEKRFPQLQHMATAKESRDFKKDYLKTVTETKKAEKESAADAKKEKTNLDWISKATNQTKGIVDSYTKAVGAGEVVRSMTGKNPAEDVSALYSFVKTLDPDSAVREGEVGLAQSMSSVQGRVETLMNRLSKGDVVDTKTVDNLKKEILRLETNAKGVYDKRMTPFKEQAKARGINEEDFTRQIDPFYGAKKEQKSESKAQQGQSDMVKVMSPDGKSGSIPKDKLEAAKKRGFKEI